MVLSFWHQECLQPDPNISHSTCKPRDTIRIFRDTSCKAIANYSNNVYPKQHVALEQGRVQNRSRGAEIPVSQSCQPTWLSCFPPPSSLLGIDFALPFFMLFGYTLPRAQPSEKRYVTSFVSSPTVHWAALITEKKSKAGMPAGEK